MEYGKIDYLMHEGEPVVLDVNPTPHYGISLQTDAYAYEEDAGWSTYDVGVVATQLGFQYIF